MGGLVPGQMMVDIFLKCQYTPLNGFILFLRFMTIYATEQSNTIDSDDESDPRMRSAKWSVDEQDVTLNTKNANADHAVTNAQSDNSDSDDVIVVGSSDSRPSYLDINDLDAVCGSLLDDDSNHVPSNEEAGGTTGTTPSSSDASTARKRRPNGRRRKKIDFGPPAAMSENMEPMYAVERIVNHKIYRASILLNDGYGYDRVINIVQ